MRRLTSLVVIALVIGGVVWLGLRFNPFAGQVTLAYIANSANNNIQVVDLDSGETLRKIYAGTGPWRLVRSPDEKQLWAQHWYSESTAVIDLNDHEITNVLPYRGPGIFSNEGDEFVTFNWPRSGLFQIDPKDGKNKAVKVSEVSQVYDLVQKQDGSGFFLARFDPMAKVDKEQFAYILFYPYDTKNPKSSGAVKSLPTGNSPIRIVATKEPFILTVDSGTNGLSLINKLGSGRGVPTCPAPKAIILSPDETRMAVLCWKGQGIRESVVVTYQTDFSVRPWPTITQTNVVTIDGGLVAGEYSPAGDRLYVVDQTNRQLLELDVNTLETRQTIATGDVPMDVELIQVSSSVRDRLKNEEGRARQAVKKILAQLQSNSASYADLSWRETGTWREASQKTGADGSSKDEPPQDSPLTSQRTQYFKGPDWFRSENEAGVVSLAQGGSNVSILQDGRFWVTPRQSLVPILYGLSNLSVDEAIRYLAGDVPGSPYLRSGIAVDVMMEYEEVDDDHHETDKTEAKDEQHEERSKPQRYFVIGANTEGQRVPQLWVDADTGYPTNLVEKYLVDQTEGHATETKNFGGIIETKFYDYKKGQEMVAMPTRMERVFDHGLVEEVQIDNVTVNSDIPAENFDLLRLGNTGRIPVISQAEPSTEKGKPGMLPSVGDEHIFGPFAPHVPYNSNPPTSGPHLPFDAEWGIYQLPVPLALQVNKLVAGGVLIQYNCPEDCADTIAKLEGIVKRYPEFVQLSPYPLMESKISLTAWQRLELLDDVDEALIVEFIEAYKGINHHAG